MPGLDTLSTLVVTPLGGSFAAQVDGVDLRQPLGSKGVDEVHAALAQHKVLVFRDQHLSPTALVALGRQLGDLTAAHPVLPPIASEHPEVLEIDATRSREDPRYRDEYENDTWHTDVSFMPDPPLGSILSGVVIPDRGGDTAFADLQAAYDTLSAPIRQLVNGLDAEHDGRAEFARFLAEHPEGGTWGGRRFTVLEPVRHPIVRAHPVTARPGLFVNPTFTTRVVGLSRAESRSLLGLLCEHATQPERTFRHRWQAGDIVMWDNRATLHMGVRDFGTASRVLHRVTLTGGVPYRPVRSAAPCGGGCHLEPRVRGDCP